MPHRKKTAKGVKRVCIPNRSTKSPERRREQKKRWFRHGQKWRTGCEGRISVVKRRHGLNRCRYKGDAGMKRLLVERLGMQTRLTPLAFAAASFFMALC